LDFVLFIATDGMKGLIGFSFAIGTEEEDTQEKNDKESEIR